MYGVSKYQGQTIEFPDHDIDPKIKKRAEWNRKFSEAIYSVYLRDKAGIRYSKRAEMQLLRLYAEGNQPVEKYMDTLFPIDPKSNTRKGYMNLSWDILSIAPKIRSIVVGMMEKIDHEIVCNAIDPKSEKEKDSIKWKMWAEKELESVFGEYGYDNDMNEIRKLIPSLPETMQELEMFMDMGATKLKQEIAMENALDYSLYMSRWKQIKKKLYEDFFDLGIAAVRDYTDPATQRVKCRYVDPINLIIKYSRSHTFEDPLFAAEIRHVTISSLRQEMAKEIASGEITEDDIKKIAAQFCGYQSNPNSYQFEYYSQENGNGGYRYDEFLICLLDAEYLSYDVMKYENRINSRGDNFVHKKDYSYNKKKTSKRQPGMSQMSTVYKCKWIPGSNYVFDYGHQNDIPRKSKNEASLSYHVYKISNKSSMSTIVPNIDNMQNTWLKLQNALAMAAPSGLAIEFGSLDNISMGGKKLNPLDVLAIRRQTGDLLFKSQGHHPSIQGNPNSSKPIFPIEGGVGAQLDEFMKVWDWNAKIIRDTTGINEAIDATMPNPETPVATSEIAVSAANNALNYFYSGYEFLKEETVKSMALRWQIVARYGDIKAHFPALGKTTMNTLRLTSAISFSEYAIKIEMKPTEEQRQRIMNMAMQSTIARKQGGVGISTSDYMFIDRMLESGGNIKYVQMYLAWREEQESIKMEEQKAASSQQQSESLLALEDKKHANALELIGAQTQKDSEIDNVKSLNRSKESDNRYKNESELKTLIGEQEYSKLVEQAKVDKDKILTQGVVNLTGNGGENNEKKK